jgi:hypothetical protein
MIDNNKSKCYARRTEEKIKYWECLPPIDQASIFFFGGGGSRLLGSNVDITIFFFMRVLNLVAQIKGITQSESNQDQVAE